MHLHCTMCFSSTLICLLVVTCHGSVVNKYQSEFGHSDNKGEHKLSDESHISDTIVDVHHHFNSSDSPSVHNHHHSHNSKNLTSPEKNSDLQQSKYSSKRNTRSAKDKLAYPLSNGNSHSEPSQSLTSSSIKKRSKSHSNGHHRSHNHHNESDHDHQHEEEHDHHGDEHDYDLPEEDSDNYYDFGGNDKSSIISASKDTPEKTTQPKIINPCANKHPRHKHDEQELEDHDDNQALPSNYHQHPPPASQDIPGRVWLYASLAVVIISLCGLFSVAVIPIMQKWFYHTLLQFLVGLAVGSLSGDGLLHLMPHAILAGEVKKHDHGAGEGHEEDDLVSLKAMEFKAVWRGLAALSGIFIFFIAERVLGAVTSHRKQKKESKLSRHPKNIHPVSRDDGANNGSVGEKLAQPKKNSYDHIREKDEKETIQMLPTEASPSKKGSNQSIHEIGFHGRSSFSLEPEASVAYRPDSESSVIVSEHHGHKHGHTHEIPQTVTAVAWMVILGDGLHNFCDGLAIGAAFASSEADGISTTVAVFCHELPHELGDFAMLLKTGMKVKQALFYNGLSSVLCFVGMIIGVALGNVHSAINWVFAGTAGMFLYIALVDMLPELTPPTNATGSGAITTLIVQVLGICIGVCVMLLIALYEHELHSIVS